MRAGTPGLSASNITVAIDPGLGAPPNQFHYTEIGVSGEIPATS